MLIDIEKLVINIKLMVVENFVHSTVVKVISLWRARAIESLPSILEPGQDKASKIHFINKGIILFSK